MRVDPRLLTVDQRRSYDLFTMGFASDFWKEIVGRVEILRDQLQIQYDLAAGEQQLGRIQGARNTMQYLLTLPAVIETEFLQLTGQLDQGPETEGPAEAGDWRA